MGLVKFPFIHSFEVDWLCRSDASTFLLSTLSLIDASPLDMIEILDIQCFDEYILAIELLIGLNARLQKLREGINILPPRQIAEKSLTKSLD
jgi:hypothetical protein